MEANRFSRVSANENNPKWKSLINREIELYDRPNDIRSDFGRDYTRILHSLAYRRLKHKTQVFFNTQNDHICTRMEHVNHVESVSFTIAKHMGLNTELTKAVSIGHDLGHAPFGHQGEIILKQLTEQYLDEKFWHEKNGLYWVDNIELLEDDKHFYKNLCLTYAVRDGIISHCGEIDQNKIYPREEPIDLYNINEAGKISPFSWEGCVVKIADKIAYIGRDIEDAVRLKFIGGAELYELSKIARRYGFTSLNTTQIIHELIIDLCKNSTPDNGIVISENNVCMMNEVKAFNYTYIYKNEKLNNFKNYVELVLKSIFIILFNNYLGENTIVELEKNRKAFPLLICDFIDWVYSYSELSEDTQGMQKFKNTKHYGKLETKEKYIRAIIDYIAGMTDQYAIKIYNEIVTFLDARMLSNYCASHSTLTN